MDTLVSTGWLAAELGADDLIVIDATWVMPGQGDPAADFAAAHILGAVFLDLASLRDTDSRLPMMMPPEPVFAERMASLGIGNDSRVVVYDNSPYHTAARAWFMLTAFGARHVAILDGGFGKWRAEGRPTEAGQGAVRPARFDAALDRSRIREIKDMVANLDSRREQVVDARSEARFTGAEPEPRADMASGHIPGSHNLPIGRLFADDGTYRPPIELRTLFEEAGIDLDRPVTTTCGSGITASVLAFALHRIGYEAALYDGSWSEWGADPTTPKA